MSPFRASFEKMKQLHQKYDRYIFPVALLGGFVIDSFTFSQINLYTSGALLAFYFVLIALCIFFFHFFDRKKFGDYLSSDQATFANVAVTWLPVVIQYAFGAIFSAFVVFYLRSASFGVSMIFIVLLVAVLIASEVFRRRFLRLDFQLGMYFAGLFLYLFFAFSVFLGQVGAVPFFISSAVAALVVALLLLLLWPLVSEKFRHVRVALVSTLLGIFVSLNGLFLFNFIPPIPLILKDIGVYHTVERTDSGGYIAQAEETDEQSFFSEIFSGYDTDVSLVSGERLYVFSAVYAPDRVGAQIFHSWEFYNETTGAWEVRDRIPFEISGGRSEGFRGYTWKTALSAGAWRVRVVTERGAVVGEANFEIDIVGAPVETVRREL